MKKNLISLVLFVLTQIVLSQKNDTVYILIENPSFKNNNCENTLNFGFSIKSKDTRFITDYYQFNLSKAKGFNKNGDFEYYTIEELRKEVMIDSIKYKTLKSLENSGNWELHNELSLKKTVLLEKKTIKKDSNGNHITKYYIIPMIYEGTRKNVIPTQL